MDGWAGWALYGLGWLLGWLLLWRRRSLPAPARRRDAVAVVIPARNEAAALPWLLPRLIPQLRPGDELVVVDDHSDDATGAVAASYGAHVVTAPELPDGWVGKPYACWHGARSTTAGRLVFVDADVRPGDDLLGGVSAALDADPGVVVSVQPWHDAERMIERASVLANVTALMGCGGFTALGRRVRTDVAFGPVLAVDRDDYERAGGHAHPAARASRTEDIVIARLVGRSELYAGGPDSTTFRMYPEGLGQLLAGWSRSIGDGVAATRWWIAIATTLWVWSLAGGLVLGITSGVAAVLVVYVLSGVQVWVLGRRAGRFGAGTAVLYPLAVAVLVTIVARASWSRARHRPATWKGRPVA